MFGYKLVKESTVRRKDREASDVLGRIDELEREIEHWKEGDDTILVADL